MCCSFYFEKRAHDFEPLCICCSESSALEKEAKKPYEPAMMNVFRGEVRERMFREGLFDLCVYNRPFDGQTQPRVMIESLAVVAIMALVNGRQIQSINSFVLDYENRKNPRPLNKFLIGNLLAEALEFVHRNESITQRAIELENTGIMGMDALHVACAEESKADYFVSCDDVLVKKLRRVEDLKVQAVGLLEFVSKEVF